MKVEYRCCAGLDVHKRTVVACVLKGELGKDPVSETKSFGTTTAEVMEMLGVAPRARGDPCGHGSHGQLLDADL